MDINKRFEDLMEDLQKNIENPKDLEYAREQVKKLASVFITEMEKMEEYTDTKFAELTKKQEIVEEKMAYLETTLRGIEKDVYDVDENYDLEVVCPYGNYEL